jgi:hypothetical protein
VRHPVAGGVQQRPEHERAAARADQGACQGAGRDVERDDQAASWLQPASWGGYCGGASPRLARIAG